MPCAKLNKNYPEKFYNFVDMDEALAVQQRVKKILSSDKIDSGAAAEELRNLKEQRHGYLILKRRSGVAFSDDDINFDGLYRWNRGERKFQHFQDLRKVVFLNTETKQFELAIIGVPGELMSESQLSHPTKLSKFYFQRYELIEFKFFDDKFCRSFDPCQNGAQCHDKPMGFSCSCNPESLQFGPLCDQPTPCADSPCKNNAACDNKFYANGTVGYECDCGTAPEGFFGPLCNDCDGGNGKGVEGVCIRFNACLDSIEHCIMCDNDNNPTICEACQGYRYVDSLTGRCAENRCICQNGVEGECPIHNKYNCESCDQGFVHRVLGENKRCDACSRNFEANSDQTDCVPCLVNFENQVPGGFCTVCPDHHVRTTDQDNCVACPEHSHRPNAAGGCELCPSSHPRRFSSDSACMAVNCPADQYANLATGWECQSCSQNWVPAGDQRSCVQCPKNFVSSGANCVGCSLHYMREVHQSNCFYCGDHYYRLAATESCSRCSEPTPVRNANDVYCQSVNCPAGQYASSNTNWVCQSCSNNQEVNDDGRSCLNCERNFYRTGSMTSCEICPDNHVRETSASFKRYF